MSSLNPGYDESEEMRKKTAIVVEHLASLQHSSTISDAAKKLQAKHSDPKVDAPMWPFTRKQTDPAGSLRYHASAVQNIIAEAFDNPGPLCNGERRGILTAWLSNFSRNLNAAVEAVENGKDMRGSRISELQIHQGLVRMCDDYGRADTMKRLEDVCGSSIRKNFDRILCDVRAASNAARIF